MPEILTPKNKEGRDLSPIEAKTGVALPIWSTGEGETNRHHPHFYKRHYLSGLRKLETRAVRFSRLQLVDKSAHDKYHLQFEGTAFPKNKQKSFEVTILNCAGYIAGHVVRLTDFGWGVTETTPEMKHAFQLPGIMTIERGYRARREIGQFLMNHAISQSFDSVKQSQIEQFIELGKPKFKEDEAAQARRYRLGMRLTNIGLGLAVDGIDRSYKEARSLQALPEEAPVCAWKVAKNFVQGYEPDYYETLEENLLAQCA